MYKALVYYMLNMGQVLVFCLNLSLPTILPGRHYYPHIAEEETGAHKG